MKDNTYDIPGMKFYLLFAQDSSFPLATRTVDPAEVFPFE